MNSDLFVQCPWLVDVVQSVHAGSGGWEEGGWVGCIRDEEEEERVAAMVGRFDVGWMGFKLWDGL